MIEGGLMRFAAKSSLVLLVILLAGCVNPWEQNYRATRATKGTPFARVEKVRIREIEPSRLAEYRRGVDERRRENPRPGELPFTEQLEEMDRLLMALRMPDTTPRMAVIGVSEFHQRDDGGYDEWQVIEQAKKVGADYVVICVDYLGETLSTGFRPVSSYVTVYEGGYYGHRRPYWYGSSSTYVHTDYIPFTYARSAYWLTGFFVREIRPSDRWP
jgi:hypothetical protein